MSNSSLVTYTKISPMKTHPRSDTIRKITIHHMAGNLSVQECGEVFQTREASANYGINGKEIGLYVDEGDRAWSTSNGGNDHQAVNIELANDQIGGDWHVSDETIQTCIKLCADICKRNGIDRLNYTGDKSGNLTMHCWFASTACPGSYLKTKFKYIADEVNKLLSGAEPTPTPTPSGNTWTGGYPTMPGRGYYLTGDGYEKYANKQPDIKLIQQFLNWAINAGLEVDGCYGENTTKAVETFQKKAGITADGSYGKDTLAAAKKYQKISSNTTKPSTNTTKPQETAKDEVKASQSAESYDAGVAGTYYVNSRTGLNIRDGAGTSYKVLTVLSIGRGVECYGYYTDAEGIRWLYVTFNRNGVKYTGYASAQWLSR